MNASRERTYGGRPVADRLDERRRRFIAAAIEVFGEKRYATSSVTDVCRAAQLSRRQFYELYHGREDLLLAAYDAIQQQARDSVVAAVADAATDDVPGTVRVAMAAYIDAVGGENRRARVAFVEIVGVSDRVEAHRDAVRGQWAELITELITAVTGTEPNAVGNSELASAAVLGAVNGLIHHWITHEPRPPIEELADVLTSVLLAVLVPADGKPAGAPASA